jgi:hypothetical protein
MANMRTASLLPFFHAIFFFVRLINFCSDATSGATLELFPFGTLTFSQQVTQPNSIKGSRSLEMTVRGSIYSLSKYAFFFLSLCDSIASGIEVVAFFETGC